MKALEALRWVIIAPEAEVKKWTTAIHAKNPSINLEVGPKVANPEEGGYSAPLEPSYGLFSSFYWGKALLFSWG